MLIATKFEILRGITSSGRLAVDLKVKPKRVVTLLDEPLFLSSGHQITHHKTVFFEEQFHDWHWSDGKLYYYSRAAQVADVLVVYEDILLGENNSPGFVSPRDAKVAATIVQWLGTHVGDCFLEQVGYTRK